jgi:succinate dehydrogenase / fumarate reductase cytochrome b subunit
MSDGAARERPAFAGLRGWITYRGGLGMLMWALHRVAGLGILLFLTLHIVDIFLLGFGQNVFNSLLVIYSAPWAHVMDVFLLFGVLFHAINGLRIIVQDFAPRVMLAEQKLVAIELVVLFVIFVPAAWAILAPLFGG